MVLNVFRRKAPDAYLFQTVSTDRFILVNCNWVQSFKLTLPLASDPEALHALMYDRKFYSRFAWAIRLSIPNGRNLFVHAIVHKDSDATIGVHVIRLSGSGTVSLMIALTDKSW